MNERDFDKLFSDKLNEEGDFPNKDMVKRRVFTRLDTILPMDNGGNRGFTKYVWMLPLLLLMGGWNGCQWWQLRALQQENLSLKTDIQGLKNTSSASFNTDTTIYKTRTIHQIDTIYKTVYIIEKTKDYKKIVNIAPINNISIENKIAENAENAENKTGNKPIKDTATAIINAQNVILNKKVKDLTSDSETLKQADILIKKDSLKTVISEPSLKDSLNKKPQNSLSETEDTSVLKEKLVQLKEPAQDSVEQALNKKITLEEVAQKPIIKKFKLNDTYLGLKTGVSAFTISDEPLKLSRWLGVAGETALSEKWRVQLSADWSSLNFDDNTLLSPLNLKDIPPPSTDYVFKHVEGKQQAVHLGLGFNYHFKTKTRVHPLAAIGYMYRIIPSFEAKYEFKNTITGDERYETFKTERHIDHWLNIGIGGEIPIRTQWLVRLNLDYAFDANKPENGRNGYAILRGGLFYKF
jgi:hypothetical protein